MSKQALELPLPALDLTTSDSDGEADARASSAPPPARPANLKRSFFHVCSGLFALALLRLLPSKDWLIGVAAAFAVFAWTAETARKRSPAVNARLMRLFSPIAHAHEHTDVNSSTWYITALLLLAVFAKREAAEIGIVVLAFADPAAGTIGRRFGKTKIRANRSLEGTLAFIVAGTITAGAWIFLAQHATLGAAAIMALAASIIGALAEIFITKLDDNFAIPVAATTAAALAMTLV